MLFVKIRVIIYLLYIELFKFLNYFPCTLVRKMIKKQEKQEKIGFYLNETLVENNETNNSILIKVYQVIPECIIEKKI